MAISDVLNNLNSLALTREDSETDAALDPPGAVIQGAVTGTDTNGNPIFETNQGGVLTAESGEFIGIGETAQISTSSGGTAQVNQPAGPGQLIQNVANRLRMIFRLEAPTTSDIVQPRTLWVHEKASEIINGFVQADLFIWSPNNGFVRVGGGDSTLGITFSTDPPPGGFDGAISGGIDLTPYNEGHIWVNTVLDRYWILRKSVENRWIGKTRNFITTPDASQTDSLVTGDTITIFRYSWFWNGVDWVVNHCCEDGPDDPPNITCSGAASPTWEPSCPNHPSSNPPTRYTCSCPI